jgi:N-carbamoyl-L-amino-acid hydrolase
VSACRPERVIADLRALGELTGGPGGARRVAWTPEWRRARAWLEARLTELPVDVEVDLAGNLWATLPDTEPGFVAVGSHLDSVPNGGWLDGALGVVAGLELLRSHAARPARPPVSLRLVDWADEEGARFGRSLFGSTAAAGRLDVDAMRHASDGATTLEQAVRADGVELGRANEAQRQLDGALAYIELHIEQGPVLEREGRSVAVVDGCAGVERHLVRLVGEAAHAGAAPMAMRRDALVAASRAIVAVSQLALEARGTATVGRIEARPGVMTIVPGEVELGLDLRHPDPRGLAELLVGAREAFARLDVQATWEPVFRLDPIRFDPGLVELGLEACAAVGAEPMAMTSGALHDAAAVAPLVPAVMLFVPSRRGISHSREEDTDERDLAVGVRALDALLDSVLRRHGGHTIAPHPQPGGAA